MRDIYVHMRVFLGNRDTFLYIYILEGWTLLQSKVRHLHVITVSRGWIQTSAMVANEIAGDSRSRMTSFLLTTCSDMSTRRCKRSRNPAIGKQLTWGTNVSSEPHIGHNLTVSETNANCRGGLRAYGYYPRHPLARRRTFYML